MGAIATLLRALLVEWGRWVTRSYPQENGISITVNTNLCLITIFCIVKTFRALQKLHFASTNLINPGLDGTEEIVLIR